MSYPKEIINDWFENQNTEVKINLSKHKGIWLGYDDVDDFFNEISKSKLNIKKHTLLNTTNEDVINELINIDKTLRKFNKMTIEFIKEYLLKEQFTHHIILQIEKNSKKTKTLNMEIYLSLVRISEYLNSK